MAGSSNAFIGLDLATLTTLQTAYISAITALASNQSYALNGRSLSRANLADVKATLGEINAAIADINGTNTDTVLVSFTGL
jgi:hypothetical protein